MMDICNMLKMHLKNNKVTVDIIQNHMNECIVLNHDTSGMESSHDELFGKKQRTRPKEPKDNKEAVKAQEARAHSDTIDDPLMYVILFMKDPTLSLLKPHDINKRVNDYKLEFKGELQSKTIKIPKSIKLNELLKVIDTLKRTPEERSVFFTCIGEMFKRNLCLNGIYGYCYDPKISSYLNICFSEPPDLVECETGFNEVLKAYMLPTGQENLKDVLKKMLVKDLKTHASILKISGITKLSKQDLIEKISEAL